MKFYNCRHATLHVTHILIPPVAFIVSLITLIPFLSIFRSVILRRNVKWISFILLPITHILIPPVAFIMSLVTLIPFFGYRSFVGHPSEPWKSIKKILANVYERFTTKQEEFAANYGHESGIPENWDGEG